MNILNSKKVEGCLESSSILDIYFDQPIEKDFAKYIGKLGKYVIAETVGKPYFRIIVRSKYTIKGSIGNKKCRIVFPDGARVVMPKDVTEIIELYKQETNSSETN